MVTDLTELMDATNCSNVEALTFPVRAVMDDINVPGAPQPAPAANLNQILHCKVSVRNPTSVIKEGNQAGIIIDAIILILVT